MFQFSLCLELGIKHPDDLIPILSSKQLADWERFYQVRPFGRDMGFFQAAMIVCALANIHKKKNAKAYKVEDFIPKFGERPEDNWKKIKKMLESMAGKKIKRKK